MPPSTLYRFRTIERAKDILAKNKLYFSSPSAFNDPFDCQIAPSFGKSPRQRKEFANKLARHTYPQLSRKQRSGKVKEARQRGDLEPASFRRNYEVWKKEFVDNCGILCLVAKPNDILMWSHYAEGHKGVCLEFQFKLGEFGDVPIGNRFAPVCALPVCYAEEFPDFDFVEYSISCKRNEAARLQFLKTIFLTKAMAWKYEQEYRIIDLPPRRGIQRYGCRGFSPTSLTGIIFGCRIEEQGKEEIRTLASARQPRPRLYQAKVKPCEFALEIVACG